MTIVVALTAVVAMPGAATAAQQVNYNVQYCASGTASKVGYNYLSNGKLTFAWCYTSTGKMTTLTVRYDRDSDATPRTISVQFGYEWTNSSGGAIAGSHWDSTGAVSIGAGQTWGARFYRSPAEIPPGSLSECMRGKIKASGTTVYSTQVRCTWG
ncbi:MAG: hypothetical protein J7518_14355 [Nocardioidaceae bacterium]|nr:hypothetical protein [Nocardioidaceae bacterium]